MKILCPFNWHSNLNEENIILNFLCEEYITQCLSLFGPYANQSFTFLISESLRKTMLILGDKKSKPFLL